MDETEQRAAVAEALPETLEELVAAHEDVAKARETRDAVRSEYEAREGELRELEANRGRYHEEAIELHRQHWARSPSGSSRAWHGRRWAGKTTDSCAGWTTFGYASITSRTADGSGSGSLKRQGRRWTGYSGSKKPGGGTSDPSGPTSVTLSPWIPSSTSS